MNLLFAQGSDTSEEAAVSIQTTAPNMRAAIVELIEDRGNVTCDEVEVALGYKHQTASARLYELTRDKVIQLNGNTRLTRSNRKAGVYELIIIMRGPRT